MRVRDVNYDQGVRKRTVKVRGMRVRGVKVKDVRVRGGRVRIEGEGYEGEGWEGERLEDEGLEDEGWKDEQWKGEGYPLPAPLACTTLSGILSRSKCAISSMNVKSWSSTGPRGPIVRVEVLLSTGWP